MGNNTSSPDFEIPAGNTATPELAIAPVEQSIAPPETLKASSGGTFSALRHYNFRLFWMGATVSNLGNWMQTVGQNWLIISLTGSPFMLGLVNFIANSPTLLLSLFGGVVADRNSRRAVLLITQNIMALLVLIMAILTFFNLINVWLVLALALGIGIVQAFNSPAYQTIMLDMVGKDDLMNAIALNSIQFNLTRIIGPSIAGLLVSVVGVAICFFINALSFMAVIAALLLIKIPPAMPRQGKNSALSEIKESLGYLRGDPILLALLVITSALSVFALPYLNLLPVFVTKVFHMGADSYGLLLTGVGVGALSGAFLLAKISSNLRHAGRYIFGGLLVLIVAMLGLGLSANFIVSMVILAFCGGAMVISNATINTVVQTNLPDNLRGRVLSVWTLCTMGLMPIGNLQSGTVAEAFGAPFAMIVNAVIFSLILGVTVFLVPKVREV